MKRLLFIICALLFVSAGAFGQSHTIPTLDRANVFTKCVEDSTRRCVSNYASTQAAIDAAVAAAPKRVDDDHATAYSGPGFIVKTGVEFHFARIDYNLTSKIICQTGASCLGPAGATWVNNGTRLVPSTSLNDDVFTNEYVYGVIPAGGLVRAGNVVTVTTTQPHGRSVGDIVIVGGIVHDRSGVVLLDQSFLGRFTVASVPSSTTLTYTQTGADLTNTTGGGHLYGDITGSMTWHSARVENLFCDGNWAAANGFPGGRTVGSCFDLPAAGETTLVISIFARNAPWAGMTNAGAALGSPKWESTSSMKNGIYGYACEYCSVQAWDLEPSGDSNAQANVYIYARNGGQFRLHNYKSESVTADDGKQNVSVVLDGDSAATPTLNFSGVGEVLGPSSGTLKDDFIKILNAQWRVSFNPAPYIFGHTNGINDTTTYQGSAAGTATPSEISQRSGVAWNSSAPTQAGAILRGDFVFCNTNCRIMAKDSTGANQQAMLWTNTGSFRWYPTQSTDQRFHVFNFAGKETASIGGPSGSVAFSLDPNNSANEIILQTASTPTGTRTVNFPDASGTLPLLESSQTWTGAQIFNATATFQSGDGNLSHNINAGSTSAFIANVSWQDRGTTKWQWQKTAGNAFQLLDTADSGKPRVSVGTASQTDINSGGTSPNRFNVTANSGTGGAEFWSGGASPAKVASISSTGAIDNSAGTGGLKIKDQGQCTMAAGTCSAQTLGHTYAAAPNCFANWTATGTLTGLLKVPSTTTTVTPASSVGTDTAQVNWFCLGN